MIILKKIKTFFSKVKNSKVQIPFSVLIHNIFLTIDAVGIYKAKKKNNKKGLIIWSIFAGLDTIMLCKKISDTFKPEEEIAEEESTTLDSISDEEFLKDDGDDE